MDKISNRSFMHLRRIAGGFISPGKIRLARKFLTSTGRGISVLFMPALCVHCRKDRWRGTPLCLSCLKQAAPIRTPICGFCGLPGCAVDHAPVNAADASEASGAADAADARVAAEASDRSVANGNAAGTIPSRFLFLMGPQLSTLIHGFKYRHLKRNIRFLCSYLRFRPDLTVWSGTFDLLVPVPIHAVRRRERGYNQAEEIAREATRYLQLPVLANALNRTRATVSQTKLNREQRAQNLESAFCCPEPDAVRGKRILLVDDVFTTGATVGRCAELLLEAGALYVGVLALAKVDVVPDLDDFALEMEAVSSYAG